jgi:WD40 repeat protein
MKKVFYSNDDNVYRINLEPEWIALGDKFGAVDSENGSAAVEIAVFSPDKNFIASGSRLGKSLNVWNTKGELVFEKDCNGYVSAMDFSPDGEFLVVAGKFNQLLVFETSNWNLIHEIDLISQIECVDFSNNGDLLALGRFDGYVSFIETRNFSFTDSLLHGNNGEIAKIKETRGDVNSLDFSDDGQYLITGGFDGNIKIWFLPEMKLIKSIKAHDNSIKSVRINKKGNCIASASAGVEYTSDNSIKLWDFNTGELLHKLEFQMGMEAVEFSPEGHYLVGGGQEGKTDSLGVECKGHIYFYNIPDNLLTEPVKQIHKEPVFRTEFLSFDKNGDELLSSHEDGTVRLWKIHCN